jgi:protein-tyrosine phosphatase
MMGDVSRWFRTYGYADVLDNLIIGAYPLDADDLAMLEWLGVQRVLNLTEDPEYEGGDRAAIEDAYAHSTIEEYRIAMTDFGDLPSLMLETATRTVNEWLDEGLRVYLHCRAGQQRSAAVAAGVLALRDGLEIDAALARVRARKPTADPLPNQREDLREWWSSRDEDPSQPPAAAES